MTEHAEHEEHHGPIIRDKRLIDPETGELRTPDPGVQETGGAVEPPVGEASSSLADELKERTADLQRLQAEYANYRKRVDRDRELAATIAKAQVVGELLTVLDDIERADAHGDLTGAFKAVTDKLIETLAKSGLEAFGHENERFDPAIHEAVQHDTSAEVDGPTVTAVLRRGYRFGERVLRPALVAVTDFGAPESSENAAE